MSKDKKGSNIGEALAELTKKYGEGTIVRLGDKPKHEWEVIPTGSIGLDTAVGIGGIPRGRMVEIYGDQSSGKSTTCLHIIANAQKQGGLVAYLDTEFAFDPSWAEKIGVDVNNLLVSQPGSAEECLDIIEALVRSNEVTLIVVDSVAAMVPQSEIVGEFGDAQMAIIARLMAQAMRKLTSIISQSNTSVIWVNQVRSKIGVIFGSPNTTCGGRSLPFYASMRLEIARIGQVKDGEKVIGSRTRVKAVKNKCAPPFHTCEFDIMYSEGISKEGEIIDLALEKGLLTKKGSWIAMGERSLSQGRENLRELLKKDAELSAELIAKLEEK